MSNNTNTVTYTGVTSDLLSRVQQHKDKINECFTKKYNINKLVYYEVSEDISAAIYREKQIKSFTRRQKVNLITSLNPDWHDLYINLTRE